MLITNIIIKEGALLHVLNSKMKMREDDEQHYANKLTSLEATKIFLKIKLPELTRVN